MWKDRCTKLQHDPTNTSSPTSDLDADIAHCYANPQDLLAADRQLLNLPDKTYYDSTIAEYDEGGKWCSILYEDGDKEDALLRGRNR